MIPLIYVKERAQGLIEYALLLILIALVVIVALTFLGSGVVNGIYYNIITKI